LAACVTADRRDAFQHPTALRMRAAELLDRAAHESDGQAAFDLRETARSYLREADRLDGVARASGRAEWLP
jgi:hypothetical protein